ncbi:hypothetical protein GCM10009798_32540 [Nocardioides panacihumi]|uniref:Polysaccharide chain length determinant N-terminal domain-containing protein n=1 Tax=Nocardioides panacihumi TaxID=400774 RepID=A0ABN2RIB0_9ACTN
MYVRDLLMSLIRRWYLVVVALLLIAGASVGVAHLVTPTYEAKASLVLIPPRDTQFPSTNRYLMLGNVGQASSVVIRALNGDETHQIIGQGLTGVDYSAAPDYTTNAPLVVLTATAKSPAAAQELLERIVTQVPAILTRLQASVGIEKSAQITAVAVTTSQKPVKVVKKQVRAVGACAAVLAAMLLMLIGGLDGFLQRRASSAAAEEDEPGTDRGSSGRRRPAAGLKQADLPTVHADEPVEDPVAMFDSSKRRGRR